MFLTYKKNRPGTRLGQNNTFVALPISDWFNRRQNILLLLRSRHFVAVILFTFFRIQSSSTCLALVTRKWWSRRYCTPAISPDIRRTSTAACPSYHLRYATHGTRLTLEFLPPIFPVLDCYVVEVIAKHFFSFIFLSLYRSLSLSLSISLSLN